MRYFLSEIKSKREKNKEEKRLKLLDAAFNLFSSDGFSNTTIENITKEAGVAKGTFYLFFKDKFDIKNHLVLKEAFYTLKNATETYELMEKLDDPIENFLNFIDIIIDDLNENKDKFKIISKDLNLGIFHSIIDDNAKYEPEHTFVKNLLDKFSETFSNENFSKDEMPLLLFSIFEMINGVGYSAIIDETPKSIDEMKPVMHKCIRLMLV